MFALAAGFPIPSKLHLRLRLPTLTRHDDLRSAVQRQHLLKEDEADAFMTRTAVLSDTDIEMPGSSTFINDEEADALISTLDHKGKLHNVDGHEFKNPIMRPPPDPMVTSWEGIKRQLQSKFGFDNQELAQIYDEIEGKESLLRIYKSMQLARQFEAACNKQYMMGKIRGFMHLDNGQ